MRQYPRLDGSPEVRELDINTPNAARIYDYHLGDAHSTAADRAAGDEISAGSPQAAFVAQSNRAFLGRAVRYCSAHGIDQFLDLGSGIPTVGNVHEIAHSLNPAARVVYVDHEDIAVAQTRRLLTDVPATTIVQADLREADTVLAAAQQTLDFTRPLALLLVAALHYIGHDDRPEAVLARYTSALPPGSALVFSQVTADERDPAEVAQVEEVFARTATPLTLRSHAEVAALIAGAGWSLAAPGLVWPPDWRPDGVDTAGWTASSSNTWAGVAWNH